MPKNRASKCKHCQHFYPITRASGFCNCPLPAWAWDVATSLTNRVSYNCPAINCQMFEHVDNWERLNALRLKSRRADSFANTPLFDHVRLDPDYDPCAKKPEKIGGKP